MNCTVVVVTHNHGQTIEKCLFSTIKQAKHIIVVDCGSKDDTCLQVNKFSAVKLIRGKNLGYGGGNNVGINGALKTQAEYIIILNPDTYVGPNTFSLLSKISKRYDDLVILGPKILMSDEKTIWSCGGMIDPLRFTAGLLKYGIKDKQQIGSHIECDFISGTCLFIPRKLLEEGLRFYEPYFLYYEDTEFCVKARKMGYRSICVPEAEVNHYEMSNITKKYYLARNHLLFVERNSSIKVKLREQLRLPKTVYEHLVDNDFTSLRGIRDYYVRRFGEGKT